MFYRGRSVMNPFGVSGSSTLKSASDSLGVKYFLLDVGEFLTSFDFLDGVRTLEYLQLRRLVLTLSVEALSVEGRLLGGFGLSIVRRLRLMLLSNVGAFINRVFGGLSLTLFKIDSS